MQYVQEIEGEEVGEQRGGEQGTNVVKKFCVSLLHYFFSLLLPPLPSHVVRFDGSAGGDIWGGGGKEEERVEEEHCPLSQERILSLGSASSSPPFV